MRYFITYIFIISSIGLFGQTDTLPSYFIKDGQVILEFDIRKYQNDKALNFSKIFEFADIDIPSILNKDQHWPQHGWDLIKSHKYIYQLRKDLEKFDIDIPWPVKYNISGSDWALPTSEVKTEVDSVFRNNLDDLEQKIARVSENGNVTFKLDGFKKARQVILSGSFNQWNEQDIKMKATENGWTISLDLQEGIYEYKFIADGSWLHDPVNELKVRNEHKTWNSILLVGETITFHIEGHAQAKQVILTGSFNNWNEKALKMNKTSDGWTIDLSLPPGKHYYKFIIDKKWALDAENIFQEPDRKGNWNSVLIIH